MRTEIVISHPHPHPPLILFLNFRWATSAAREARVRFADPHYFFPIRSYAPQCPLFSLYSQRQNPCRDRDVTTKSEQPLMQVHGIVINQVKDLLDTDGHLDGAKIMGLFQGIVDYLAPLL